MGNPSDGMNIPVRVQTEGDAGKGAADGIKEVAAATAAATPVIRDYATAEAAAADSAERFAETQKGWQANGNKGSALASDPATFMDSQVAGQEAAADAAKTAALERQVNLLGQKQIIADLELEATEKEAAQDMVITMELREQVTVRERALQLQIRYGMAEAEAFTMAEREIAAQRTITEIKAQQLALNNEMIAKEAASQAAEKGGGLVGRKGKAGLLAQNLGASAADATTIGVAAIAAQQLATMIYDVAKSIDEERIASLKQTQELEKQAQAWNTVANAAQGLADISGLQEDVTKKVVELQQKLQLMPDVADKMGSALVDLGVKGVRSIAGLVQSLGNIPDNAPLLGHFINAMAGVKDSTEDAKAKVQEYIAQLGVLRMASTDAAKIMAAQWEALMSMPVSERMDAMSAKIKSWKETLGQIDQSTPEGGQAWMILNDLIGKYEKGLKAAGTEMGKLGDETEKNVAKIRESIEGSLPAPEKLEHLYDEIDKVKSGLGALGLAAKSPEDALQEMNGLTEEQQRAVSELALEWETVLGKIQKINDEQAKADEAEEKRREAAIARGQKELEERDAILKKFRDEDDLLRAKLTGNERVIKQAESQLKYEEQIDALKKHGFSDAEAAAQAKITKELRDQVTLMEQERKLSEMRQGDDVEAAKAGHSKTRLRDAEVTDARLKKEHAAEDAGATPEEAKKMGDEEGERARKAFNKEHHITDGNAQPSDRDRLGSDKADNLDDLDGKGSKDFQDLKKKHLGPLLPKGKAKTEPQAPGTDDPGQTGEAGEAGNSGVGGDAANAIKDAGEKVKDAGDSLKDAADGFKEGADDIKEAGGAAREAAAEFTGAAGEIVAGFQETQSAIADLKSQIANLRTFDNT